MACCILLALILPLVGCSGKVAQPSKISINRNFSSKVSVEHAGKNCTAMFTSDIDGCTAVFSSPAEINGLTVSLRSGVLTYSLGKLSFSQPPQDFQINFLSALCQAMSDAAATQKTG